MKKKGGRKQITVVTLTPGCVEQLREVAETCDRSRSWIVERFVTRGYQEWKKRRNARRKPRTDGGEFEKQT